MLRTTFLGHQGWLLSTESTTVLVDPLLTEAFGHGGHLGRVFPPRRIDPAAFPEVDAVILTHEHDDHFDVPSLHRLDRRIPVYLSARSSVAAHELLTTMRFGGRSLVPESRLEIGDLVVHTFTADHRRSGGDEFDVVPMFVQAADGDGSLLTSVDARPTDAMLDAVGALGTAGIWCYAHNLTSSAFADARGRAVLDDDAALVGAAARRRYDRVATRAGAPALTLVCGGGWSFPEPRAWLDRSVFPLDAVRVAAMLEPQVSTPVVAPEPGQTWEHRDGQVREVERAPFVQALPPEHWPERTWAPSRHPQEYAPATGRTTLSSDERARLVAALCELARHWFDGPVFRGACSLTRATAQGRSPTVALSLRTSEAAPWVLAYDPTSCSFIAAQDQRDPIESFASGLELWATDLLALLEGEVGASAICFAGRLRHWNHAPAHLLVTAGALWSFAHPLHRPAATARLYRTLLDAQPEGVPTVPARRSL